MAGLATKISALFFALFAVVHVVRIVQGWEVNVGGTFIPLAVSYVAAPVSALLAYGLWKACTKKE